jgi:hypothetical protein
MSRKLASPRHPFRTVASLFAFASSAALLSGCAADGEAPDATPSDSLATTQQALIGGTPATADHFRSTVGIHDDCTAAKVGPRLFLTAAHCVALGRPGRGEPVPEDFPPNDGVRNDYLPGQSLLMMWGLDSDDDQQGEMTIVRTSIHPSWWECPLCQDPILGSGAADVALIEIAENTPEIPEARVELGSIAVGAAVVKVGWGCEERTNVDPNTLDLGRYKRADATIIPGSDIRHDESPITDGQLAQVDGAYLITAGHAQDEDLASLCLGDSGGPLYLPDNSDPRIVGVNSNYTFPPTVAPSLGGVSWTDWHTKTSLDSVQGVGQWLMDLGVNTVGGEVPTSDCTCPAGCDSVVQAAVPFTHSGPVDTCYFFDSLGFSVNNHSMVEVSLNGQNVTNRWIGNWEYPAERDGGFYLYVKGQKSWSWIQAQN